MRPVVFVPVDRDATAGPPEHANGAVVVGVSEGSPSLGTARFDMLLTTAADAPAPWVVCASSERTMSDIESAVRSSPAAAITLTQVLRVTEGLPVPSALAAESMAYSMLQHSETFRAWLRSRPAPAVRSDHGSPVLLERRDKELDIVLQRPHLHNALNAAMRDALCEAFDLVAHDETITTVHLRGAGASFCSGGDLDEFGLATDAATAHRVRMQRSVGRAIHEHAPRVIAHVHGSCVGAGIELAAFAGRVVAAPGTEFRLPEISMGLIPGAGGTVSIPRRIGRHRTAYLALSGSTLDVATAAEWGLVDAVV